VKVNPLSPEASEGRCGWANGFQLSADQLSVISNQLSAISGQQFAIGNQESVGSRDSIHPSLKLRMTGASLQNDKNNGEPAKGADTTLGVVIVYWPRLR